MSNSISTLLLRNLSDVFGEGDPLRLCWQRSSSMSIGFCETNE